MNLSELRNTLPDYARNLKLNLDSVLNETGAARLDGKQVRAIALASAIAARHAPLVAAIEVFAAEQLSPEERSGAKSASAIMAMNKIYYRATHLIHNDEYGQLRTGLRMNSMANSGLDKVTFELASLAVSAQRLRRVHGLTRTGHPRARRQRAERAEHAQGSQR